MPLEARDDDVHHDGLLTRAESRLAIVSDAEALTAEAEVHVLRDGAPFWQPT